MDKLILLWPLNLGNYKALRQGIGYYTMDAMLPLDGRRAPNKMGQKLSSYGHKLSIDKGGIGNSLNMYKEHFDQRGV